MEKTNRRLFFPSGRMAAWEREQNNGHEQNGHTTVGGDRH